MRDDACFLPVSLIYHRRGLSPVFSQGEESANPKSWRKKTNEIREIKQLGLKPWNTKKIMEMNSDPLHPASWLVCFAMIALLCKSPLSSLQSFFSSGMCSQCDSWHKKFDTQYQHILKHSPSHMMMDRTKTLHNDYTLDLWLFPRFFCHFVIFDWLLVKHPPLKRPSFATFLHCTIGMRC